jgi:hypothetical protein
MKTKYGSPHHLLKIVNYENPQKTHEMARRKNKEVVK